MRVSFSLRTLLSAVLLPILCSCLLADTDTNSSSVPPINSERLLQRAYTLSRSLDAPQRAALIATLLECPSCNQTNHEKWAGELFAASLELPPGISRERDQDTAIGSMAAWNPLRALRLLNQMDAPSAAALQVFFNRRGRNVQAVFYQVLRSEGEKSLPLLRQSLQKQGISGYYPYSAAIPLLQHSSSQGDRELLFQEAVNFYQRSPATPANELDFLDFLRGAQRQMPSEEIQVAAAIFANRLQAYAAENTRSDFVLSLNTSQGRVVLDNPGDRLIWEALPTLEQIDSSMAEQLTSRRSAVSAVQGATVYQQIPEQRLPANAPIEQSAVRAEWDRAQRLIARAGTDPEKAAAEASRIADPYSKVNALAEIARIQASRDPAVAAELLREAAVASHELRLRDEQIRATSDMAKTAEQLHDADLVRTDLKSAFSMAHTCILGFTNQSSESKLLESSNGFGLLDLVAVGTRTMPHYTMELIGGLGDDATEAYLYIQMAKHIRDARNPLPVVN